MEMSNIEQGDRSKDIPPSNQSLLSDLKKAKQESNGAKEFIQGAGKVCCAVVCGPVAIIILLGILTAVPISMIVMGSLYLDKCPAERYIPIYLIVGGAFGLFSSLCNMCGRVKNRKSGDDDNKPGCLSALNGLISCFSLAWFIAGNVWVYRTFGHYSEDQLAANFCDPTLYLFAFWLLTASYIVVGVIFVVAICGLCVACIA